MNCAFTVIVIEDDGSEWVPYGDAAALVGKIVAARRALEKMGHGEGCWAQYRDDASPNLACNCGYDAVMAELDRSNVCRSV
jgi:hypothetical protein